MVINRALLACLLHEHSCARFISTSVRETSRTEVSTQCSRTLLKANPEQERRKSFASKPKGRTLRLTGAMFGLVVFLLSTSSLFAQTGSQETFPKIECREPMYDFGTAGSTGSVEHTFVIWNNGNGTLQIDRVMGCCGATTKLSDKAVSPGTNTTLRIMFLLLGRSGKQQKNFHIKSNDPQQPYYRLGIMGMVSSVVDIRPANANFGRVLSNDITERHVDIFCQTNFAFHITNVVSAVPKFVAEHESARDGISHRVTIRTVPPLPFGVTHGKIQIFTDRADYPQIDIPAVAIVSSDIVVVPQEIVLDEAVQNPRPVTRSVAIRSRSRRIFKILRIVPPQPEIEVKVHHLRGDVYRCDLENIMPFPDIDGKNIVITTDHEDAREILIPIRVVSNKTALQERKMEESN